MNPERVRRLGQLALEKATCANLASNLQISMSGLETSAKVGEQFRFPELALRVVGVEAGMRRLRGQDSEAWKQTIEGLHRFWQGSYSWERLYQFYSVMRQCAKDAHSLYAAQSLSLQSIDLVEKSAPEDASLRAMLYLRLSNTLRAQNETSLADLQAEKAASLLKTVSDVTAHKYVLLTQIEFAELQLRQGNAQRALSSFEPVKDLLETQHDVLKLDLYSLQGDIFRQLRQLDNAVTSYQKGVQVAERWAEDPQDSSMQLNWTLATAKAYRGLVRALLDLSRHRDALSTWERFRNRSLNNGRASGKPLRTVEAGGTFAYTPISPVSEPHLIYAVFEDGMQVWVVNRSQIRQRWIPVKQEDLSNQLHEFAKQCADPSLGTDQAGTLYSLFLQPIIDDLPRSGMIAVELDDSLWGLSFEALRSGEGHYFAENHTVVYSPGLFAEAALREPKLLTSNDPMLLVDASQTIAAAPLPGHSEELKAVKQTFVNTQVLGPGPLTIDAINHALDHSSEFHFSGHGSPGATGTALVIGSHLAMGASNFNRETLKHLQLAVLSACGSGSAKKGAFDEGNLVRSFLSGGVPWVIASRWDVDSRSTARFMESFYGHVRGGEAVATALQNAQAEMRSINDHPYYWAAFTLAGRAN